MTVMRTRWTRSGALLVVGALLVAGCMRAGLGQFEDAQALLRQGKTEEALALLEQTAKDYPRDFEYRSAYLRQREAYVQQLLARADAAREGKAYAEAEALYRRALKYDPEHPRGLAGLAQIAVDRRHDELIGRAEALVQAGKPEEGEALVRTVLAENPRQSAAVALLKRIEEGAARQRAAAPSLGAAFRKPITLEFRDANLKAIFEVIARTTQINFIFDRDVRPDLKSTIFVRNTTLEDVLQLLLVTNQLEKRILNENTVLIYPNTPAKNKDYQEMVVKAFYLANADVKQTLNMIKTLVKTRDVFIDEKLNLLVMKDTPDAVRLAEKLIATQDRAEPEVMLEVEVMEVKRSRLLDLGIQWPNTFTVLNIANQQTQSTTGGVVVTTTAQTRNILTLETLRNLTAGNVAVSPAPQLNLKKEDGDAQILANPRIRVKNKEKAKVHIGEKVPVITTTVTANVGVSENVSYLDVGLKLDVEPIVSLDNEVSIKVGLEVSNIVREIRSATGTITYQVGTRNAATHLRLKDGETQVLAGLIADEERSSASKVPGLGDLPLVGRLFSSQRDEANKTEIILLITPHILRNLPRLEHAMGEFASGTESAIGAPPLNLRPSPAAGAEVQLTTGGGGGSTQPVFGNRGRVPEAAASAAGALQLSLTAPSQVNPGQEFNLLVNANAGSDVSSVEFELRYDPALMEVVRVQEGGFLRQGGGSTRFQGVPVAGTGRLAVSVTREAGASRGGGAVAVVTLRALAQPGAASLTLENARALGPNNAPLDVPTPAAAAVNIAVASPGT